MPDYETLLAIGVTLIMAGVIGRGLAAQSRRELARRKQHRLDARKSADALLNEQLDRPPSWLEQNFGLLANLVLAAGVVVTVVGFARR